MLENDLSFSELGQWPWPALEQPIGRGRLEAVQCTSEKSNSYVRRRCFKKQSDLSTGSRGNHKVSGSASERWIRAVGTAETPAARQCRDSVEWQQS
ncbi:hypothetical protein MHYP_G00184970 [Metynnis hypsauchen]